MTDINPKEKITAPGKPPRARYPTAPRPIRIPANSDSLFIVKI
jgi:hypothetical protein